MAKAKPTKTVHRAVGFVAVRKDKEPRVIWQELEARGAKHVACAQLAVGDRIVGLSGKAPACALVYADASGLHSTKLEPGEWNGLALRDDGSAAIVFAENAVSEVAFPSGEAEALDTGAIDGAIEAGCYAGEHIVLLVKREAHALVLTQRNGHALEPLASRTLDEFVFSMGGRANVVVVATDEKETSRVLVVRDGAFHDRGRIKQPVNLIATRGESLLASGLPGTFEIDLTALEL